MPDPGRKNGNGQAGARSGGTAKRPPVTGTAKRPAVGTAQRRAVGNTPRTGTRGVTPAGGKGGVGFGIAFLIMALIAGAGVGVGLGFRDKLFGKKPPAVDNTVKPPPPLPLPPSTTSPTSQTVTEGQSATFTVTVTGPAPLACQWRKNGANIGGATAATYTTPATTLADNGARYSVVITGAGGSVTSPEAVLTVNPRLAVPPPPPLTPDNGLAEKTIAEGRAFIAGLNYGGARDALGRVGTMKVSPELAKLAAELGRKAETFDQLTREVKPRPDADKPVSTIELANRRTIEGVATRNDDGSYTVVTGTSGSGGMTLKLSAADIVSIKEKDPAARRAELRAALAERAARFTAGGTPVENYDAAVFCLENGLRPESLEYLEKAWAAAGKAGKDLAALVAEDQAGKYFAHANWLDSIGQEFQSRHYCRKVLDNPAYRATSFGPAAEKLLAFMDARKGIKGGYTPTYSVKVEAVKAPEDTRPTITDIGKPPPPPAKAAEITVSQITGRVDLSAANRSFEEGIRFMVDGRPGSANSNYNLSQAVKRFREALAVYERAAQSDKGNSSLESRILECNRNIFGCNKMMTL